MASARGGTDSSQTIEALEARLEDGYARIESAKATGIDVTAWEAFWLDLLRQYEVACIAAQVAEAA